MFCVESARSPGLRLELANGNGAYTQRGARHSNADTEIALARNSKSLDCAFIVHQRGRRSVGTPLITTLKNDKSLKSRLRQRPAAKNMGNKTGANHFESKTFLLKPERCALSWYMARHDLARHDLFSTDISAGGWRPITRFIVGSAILYTVALVSVRQVPRQFAKLVFATAAKRCRNSFSGRRSRVGCASWVL